MNDSANDNATAPGLGIDAGGTRTRWALAAPPDSILAEGSVRGLSALQVRSSERGRLRETLSELADAVLARGRPARVHAGLTGFSGDCDEIRGLIASPLGLTADAVTVGSDIETAYLDLFEPGEGYVVYAGTGSVAAFIDEKGVLHRAGGRGQLLDDAGGGFWIAREAMRHIWRAEDARPESWRDSPMAREVFKVVGGPNWSLSRQYLYGTDRGEFGRLALAVATAADSDPVALEILRAAGHELARLGGAMTLRYGPRPIALAGRALELHPVISETARGVLSVVGPVQIRVSNGHHAAARIALNALPHGARR